MKHLIDLDDQLLAQARVALGTTTMKETVHEALRIACNRRRSELNAAVNGLAALVAVLPISDREEAW